MEVATLDPRLSDPTHGRRCDPRYGSQLNAVLQVPIDEAGTGYLKAKATVNNVSQVGLCIHLKAVDPPHVPILAKVGKMCSIACEIPGSEAPAFLIGKIAWVKKHETGDAPNVDLGVKLTDTQYGEHYRLLRYLDRLRRAEKRRSRAGAASQIFSPTPNP